MNVWCANTWPNENGSRCHWQRLTMNIGMGSFFPETKTGVLSVVLIRRIHWFCILTVVNTSCVWYVHDEDDWPLSQNMWEKNSVQDVGHTVMPKRTLGKITLEWGFELCILSLIKTYINGPTQRSRLFKYSTHDGGQWTDQILLSSCNGLKKLLIR